MCQPQPFNPVTGIAESMCPVRTPPGRRCSIPLLTLVHLAVFLFVLNA